MNLVPLVWSTAPPGARIGDGRLADVAPTLLGVLGLPSRRR